MSARYRSIACCMCLLAASSSFADITTVRVKIMVDDEEPRNERTWTSTLEKRLDNASRVLEQYSDLRFSVVAFDKWRTTNGMSDFARTLKEFETTVKPEPADLVIGFSSQHRFDRGRSHLGGTRGPLQRHILIREGSPATIEVERLEVLVHEIGHYLGAAHSKQADSVMRPVLGDGMSRFRDFRIGFDQHNAEVIRLVSREVRERGVKRMHDLSIQTKGHLRQRYVTLAKEFPKDPTARRYALLMDQSIRYSLSRRQKPKAEVSLVQQGLDQLRRDREAARKKKKAQEQQASSKKSE